MENNRDMELFNKLSEEEQQKIIESYIDSLPKEEQQHARKFILGE